MRLTSIALAAGSCLAACSSTPPHAANPGASAQFERLKSLAGSWTTPANEHHLGGTIRYTLTAGGSAVQEEFYPGEPHAMVTLYHMDGEDLVLTHYCSARNQPRMRAGPTRADGAIPFEFDGGTNIDPERDGHMHSCVVRIDGPKSARTWWTYFVGGKLDHTTEFVLSRP